MIYYCEQCKQYWSNEQLHYLPDWGYCTIDGIRISLCPTCVEEAHEIIKDLPDLTEEVKK